MLSVIYMTKLQKDIHHPTVEEWPGVLGHILVSQHTKKW